MYDVVVVGGGPTGCYTASLLAKRDLDVHVLEEHSDVGKPVDCSGVISSDAFAALNLPNDLKLGEISNLTLISPSQLEVRFSPSFPLALILDRAAFDREIANQTLASGAAIHFGKRVVGLHPINNGVELDVRSTCNDHLSITSGQPLRVNGQSLLANRQWGGDNLRVKLSARMVILAGGPRYRLQKKLEMGAPLNFLRTAQIEVEASGIGETKILMGSQVAPASFAWIVSFWREGRQFARIGVSAKQSATPFLTKLIDKLRSAGHLISPSGPIRSWVIPVSPIKRTFADRVLAVGDAAGQTKPTTGGGIYYGLLCAEEAAKTTIGAFKKGNFSAPSLQSYEKSWRQRLGMEIKVGAFFRRLVEKLSDKEIDDLFRIVQSDGILSAVNKKARFDWHRNIIYLALRHPGLGRIFLRGLFR